MGAYLVTGSPGCGKSTIVEELARRGYAAYNTDDLLGVTLFENAQGEIVEKPVAPIDWSIYSWNWQSDKIEELLKSADIVFLGAVVGNQSDFYAKFDKIFVLTVDEVTQRQRLLERTTNDFGKHPEELAGILGHRERMQAELLAAPGAVAIDASQDVNAVVAAILEAAEH